jgi:hypothetical protein
MSWLLREDEVLAVIEEQAKGRLRPVDGALLLRGRALVHTLTTAEAVDVAWCVPVDAGDGSGKRCLEVRRTATLGPRRVARPRPRTASLVVAGEGAFERWRLHVGDRLEIREA